MAGTYARWIDRWETSLATRDRNRVVRPFEWGLEWLGVGHPNGDPRAQMRRSAARAVAESDSYYAYRAPSDYRMSAGHLTFTSPVDSPYPENNLVHGDFFPAKDRRRAVVVLPQWNADAAGHLGLCRLLARFGVAALRMSLAYHDRRKPPETARADYHVSSNIGRTLHAGRQSVIDARACLDWLGQQGYRRLGILGTSLGSCVAFIAAAHDRRVRCGVFNHVSTYFSDVVWTGLSTRHVRLGFGDQVRQDELREYWAPISPASYFDRLIGRDLMSLLVWARYDTTFLPQFSRDVIEAFRARGLNYQVRCLPCGHYTTGRFPFKLMDGLAVCRYLATHL
jgi:hypothetical protein